MSEHQWESDGDLMERYEVPGGWIYRRQGNEPKPMVFVPNPDPEKGSISQCIDIVFSGEGPHLEFVEVEDMNRKSVSAGKWVERDDGFSALRICARDLYL